MDWSWKKKNKQKKENGCYSHTFFAGRRADCWLMFCSTGWCGADCLRGGTRKTEDGLPEDGQRPLHQGGPEVDFCNVENIKCHHSHKVVMHTQIRHTNCLTCGNTVDHALLHVRLGFEVSCWSKDSQTNSMSKLKPLPIQVQLEKCCHYLEDLQPGHPLVRNWKLQCGTFLCTQRLLVAGWSLSTSISKL